MSNDLNIDPNVIEFVDHLEGGLAAAGLSFDNYLPQYVTLEHADDKSKTYNGLIFSQVANPSDNLYNVCVAQNGVHFRGEGASMLPFNDDQPPSKLAILFLVAIIQGDIINPPSCPHCEDNKKP